VYQQGRKRTMSTEASRENDRKKPDVNWQKGG
jgi:hypothetical protein